MATQRRILTVEEEDLKTARRFFYGGFLALPLLWLLSATFFWGKLRRERVHPDLKFYVYGSALGAVVAIAGILAWVIYFQLNVAVSESLQRLLVVTVPLNGDDW
ncbi:Gamma-secretase subunit PEN-2 [Hondaea fermentalgiana]|uniref:Gamma-secretase subunit PEN-2 n=1 Tax=Hondaea fermentalgiana TaxID=2315210 RepID=A0A2R5GUD6_9STRA|nr:Gamma-secretase subunit PEN-2 [Hondaea fermentalgiana]|eukprot:GBG34486.1 Gamma-secretase subunit PEN-2 [Hondaea fermentalgiana]